MLRCVVAALTLLAIAPPLANAHGPCGCLSPTSGPPGTRVAVDRGWFAYKIIFNPDRPELYTEDGLYRQRLPGVPVTVYREEWRYSERPANHGDSFTVPAAEPGRYLIALYDGSEGGQHYTWEWFTVAPESTGTASTSSEEQRDIPVWLASLAAAAALAIGVAAGLRIGHGKNHRRGLN